MEAIPIFSFAAYSGTGKTTLMEQVIRRLKAAGLRIAAIKHDAHGFEIDHAGKDSWRFAQAGSDVTIVSSPEKTACILARPLAFHQVAALVGDVDLIVVEGYKKEGLTQIGLCRKDSGKGFTDDLSRYAAIVTDRRDIQCEVPLFDLEDIEGIAGFILENRHRFTRFLDGNLLPPEAASGAGGI